jgi:hypothetical protein
LWVGFRIPRATLVAVVTGSGCVLVLSSCKGSTAKKEGRKKEQNPAAAPSAQIPKVCTLSICLQPDERHTHTHMRERQRDSPLRETRELPFSLPPPFLCGDHSALLCVVVRLLGLPKRMGIGIQSLSPAAKSCANFWLEVGTHRETEGGWGSIIMSEICSSNHGVPSMEQQYVRCILQICERHWNK